MDQYKSRYEPFVEDERGLDTHLRAMRENATYGGHVELSAFAHMTRRNVKVIQPGLVYVIEWDAGGWEDGATRSPPMAGPSACSEQAESSSTSRWPTRRVAQSVSPSKAEEAKGKPRIKLGKGYYVYEEVSSDEEEGAIHVKVEATLSIGSTVYVA